MDHNTVLDRLRRSPLFRHLERDSLARLVASGKLKRFETDDHVVREGELSSELYIVVAGTVNVTVSEDTKEVFICSIGEGEIVGEAGIFGSVKRTANIVSAGSSVILIIQRSSLLEFLRKAPATGMKFLMIMIFSLLRKLRSTNQELAFERKYDIGQEDIDDIIRGIMEEVEAG